MVVEWEEETSDRQISMRVGDLACIFGFDGFVNSRRMKKSCFILEEKSLK